MAIAKWGLTGYKWGQTSYKWGQSVGEGFKRLLHLAPSMTVASQAELISAATRLMSSSPPKVLDGIQQLHISPARMSAGMKEMDSSAAAKLKRDSAEMIPSPTKLSPNIKKMTNT